MAYVVVALVSLSIGVFLGLVFARKLQAEEAAIKAKEEALEKIL